MSHFTSKFSCSYCIGLLLIICLCIIGKSHAQSCCGQWDLLETGEHSSYGSGLGVATNDSGHVYLAGYFTDTLFWHGQTLVSALGADGFLAKYDDSGAPIWIRQISGGFSSSSMALDLDPAGNVFVTGKGFNSIDLGAGMVLNSNVLASCFWVAKYDPNGNPVWGVMEGGNSPNPSGGQHPAESYGIAVDANGDVYLAGEIFPSYILGGQVGWTTPIYGQQAAIIKYNGQNGNFLWMNHCGGPAGGFEYAQDVCIGSDGNVYAVGTYGGDGLFGLDTLFNGNDFNAFVTKLDAQTGNFLWATSLGGTGWDEGSGITADGLGHVYATGRFQGIVAAGNQVLVAPMNGSEMWVARLDEQVGNIEWAQQSLSSFFTYGLDVRYGADHRVIVGGYYWDTLEVDTITMISAGRNDLFVLQLDSSGNGLCLDGIGGTGGDNAYNMTLDPQGRPYITGFYRDSIFFDGQWRYSRNLANNNSNVLMARLGQVLPRHLNDGFCDGNSSYLSTWPGYGPYLWSTGDTSSGISVNAPGTYWVEFGTANCLVRDSFTVSQYPTPMMNLGPDTFVTSGQSITLDAGNPGASYIWSTGDTTRTISVGPGVYIVTITNSYGCSTKDDMVVLLMTDREEFKGESQLHIYPQPATEFVWLQWKEEIPKGKFRLEIYDLFGRKIRSISEVDHWPYRLETRDLLGVLVYELSSEKRLISRGKLIIE